MRNPGEDDDSGDEYEGPLVPLGEVLAQLDAEERDAELSLSEDLGEFSGLPIATHALENAILGRIMVDGEDALEECVDQGLTARHFQQRRAALLYDTIVALAARKELISRHSVLDELLTRRCLSSVTERYLTIVEGAYEGSNHAGFSARLLVKHGTRRQAFDAVKKAQADLVSGMATAEVLDGLQSEALRLSQARDTGTLNLSSTLDEVMKALPILGGKRAVQPSHFLDFDSLVGGFAPGELVLIAARPSMGKTAHALSLLYRLAVKHQVPSAFFSLEMGGASLVERLIAIGSGVALRKPRATLSESSSIARCAGEISEAPLYIDDTSTLAIGELRARARRMVSRHGVRAIFVDYLQLLRGSGAYDKRHEEVGEVSRGLKALARELRLPVIALAQLSRQVEGRTEKRPTLSDLRESGDLEQDADVVSFLYREGYYRRATPGADENEAAEWIIAKNRNGPTGTVTLAYRSVLPAFADFARGP